MKKNFLSKGISFAVSIAILIPGNVVLAKEKNVSEFSMNHEIVEEQSQHKNYPVKFDLREINKVNPVRNQGNVSCCWSFAATASLESNILMKDNKRYDFSEIDVATHNLYDRPNYVGTMLEAAAYYLRGEGPVLENDAPFPSSGNQEDVVRRDGNKPVMRVEDINFVPQRKNPLDNDMFKKAIMENGAVDTYIHFYETLEDRAKVYNKEKASFYWNTDYTGAGSPLNHQVIIVGWDDKYPKENFINTPPGNGAFIAQNSWGSKWGDKGYFYVSYYDKYVTQHMSTQFLKGSPVKEKDKIYQYDPLGFVTNIGVSNSNTDWFANVFTSTEKEKFTSAGFYALAPNTTYEVYLQPDYEKNGFSNAIKVKEGTFEYGGYHTVKVDKPINLIKDKKFAVLVKVTTPGEVEPIAVEYPWKGYSSKATANAGESFISTDGSNWSDLTEFCKNTNVCLKAYTEKDNAPATKAENIISVKSAKSLLVKDNDPDNKKVIVQGYLTSKDATFGEEKVFVLSDKRTSTDYRNDPSAIIIPQQSISRYFNPLENKDVLNNANIGDFIEIRGSRDLYSDIPSIESITEIKTKADAPIITIDGIEQGKTYTEPVIPSIAINNETATVNMELNGRDFSNKTEISKPGVYFLKVIATDGFGNISIKVKVFTITNPKPTITVTGIEDNKTYNGAVTPVINVDIKDSYVVTLLDGIFYNGKEISAKGKHVLMVTAISNQGEVSTRIINFSIE